MTKTIRNYLHPAYFISYSRRQSDFAMALKSRLAATAHNVWFDRDREEPGDVWFQEIVRGISSSDELVLLLSDSAATSDVIRREIKTAQEHNKPIRPLVIAPLSGKLHPDLAELHRWDVTNESDENRRLSKIVDYLENPSPQPSETITYKRLSCRGIYPQFSATFTTASGLDAARTSSAQLNELSRTYPQSSTIWLNAGLVACVAGNWDDGLSMLRAYAWNANSFPGWYFYALHLPRRQNVLGLYTETVDEALVAIHNALAIQPHPFALLVAAVLEAGANRAASCSQRMQEFASVISPIREERGEAMRAFWCLQPSLNVLRHFEPQVRSYLREIAT